MMEITKIRDGVMDYADQFMMSKMGSKEQFLLGLSLGILSSKAENVITALGDNELVKALGIIQGDQVDYNVLFAAAMAQIKRQGKLVWDVPMLGRLTFDEQDLRDLHQCIAKQGGVAE